MKKLTLSVLITSVIGLTAYTMAGAQGPQGRGPGGPGGAGGPGRGPGGGVVRLLRGLDLTEEQQAQLKALRDEQRDGRGAPADVQLHRQLEAEIFAEAPDAAKLASIQQQILQAQAARIAKQVAAEQRIAQVLTAEQRATVRERLERAPTGQARGFRGEHRFDAH